jgi:hypothetical protein
VLSRGQRSHLAVEGTIMALPNSRFEYLSFSASLGSVGGLIGGIFMGAVSMLMFPMFDLGTCWRPFNLIAAVVHPHWGELSTFVLLPTTIGIVIQLALSVFVGMLIAWLVRPGQTVLLRTLLVSMLLWLVMNYLFLPQADPLLYQVFPPWAHAVAYFCYGLGLGVYLSWRTPQFVL